MYDHACMNNSFRDGYVDAKTFNRDYCLSPRLFFLLIKEGKFAAYKPSRRKTLVKRADVERWLEASRTVCDVDKIVDETTRELGVGK